jgi:hypothetical protein
MRPALALLLALCLQLAADTNKAPISITIEGYQRLRNGSLVANVTTSNATANTLLVWLPSLHMPDKSSTTNLVAFCKFGPSTNSPRVLQPGESSTGAWAIKEGLALPWRLMVKVKSLETNLSLPLPPITLAEAGKVDDLWFGPFPAPPRLTLR